MMFLDGEQSDDFRLQSDKITWESEEDRRAALNDVKHQRQGREKPGQACWQGTAFLAVLKEKIFKQDEMETMDPTYSLELQFPADLWSSHNLFLQAYTSVSRTC